MLPLVINGDVWRVVTVGPDDPRLMDRTGSTRIATTDPMTYCVYVSREVRGELLERVIRHEAAHCAMISYDLMAQLRRLIPESSWVPVEEWVCNFLADYGPEIIHASAVALGRTDG